MATIALFHFHAHFDLCRTRIELLRRLNPSLRIFGLYGGDPAMAADARTLEEFGIENVYFDAGQSPAWNKKNTDLAVCGWYRHFGRTVPFDRVHVLQWDLLFFAPIDAVYPPTPRESVLLTGLVPLSQIAHFWDWTAYEPHASESAQLLAQARTDWKYQLEPYACIGPGYSLSRDFLDKYSTVDIEDVGHDELRLPLFAQILGFELGNTGFYPRWQDPEVERVFNADPIEIEPVVVESELRRDGGRRVFHPCRERFDSATIESLLGLTVR